MVRTDSPGSINESGGEPEGHPDAPANRAPVLAITTDEDARRQELTSVVERVAIVGDLSKLGPADRIRYYARLCESLDLNPLTRPFEYVYLNSKLTLYARKDATDQLRATRKVSILAVERTTDNELGLHAVRVTGTLPDGRRDEAVGIVAIKGLSGQDLANAFMKAETKGKRRLTLSLVGLGFLDESEVVDIPGAQVVQVNADGQIETPPEPPPTGPDALRAALGLNDSAPAESKPPELAQTEPGADSPVAPPPVAADQTEGEQEGRESPATTPPVRCAHPASAHESVEGGVRCKLCDELIATRDPIGEAMKKPRTRRKPDPEGTFTE